MDSIQHHHSCKFCFISETILSFICLFREMLNFINNLKNFVDRDFFLFLTLDEVFVDLPFPLFNNILVSHFVEIKIVIFCLWIVELVQPLVFLAISVFIWTVPIYSLTLLKYFHGCIYYFIACNLIFILLVHYTTKGMMIMYLFL